MPGLHPFAEITNAMLRSIFLIAALSLFIGCVRREPQWQPEAAMDDQLFPSLVIATHASRPLANGNEQTRKPDPYLLGDRFGLLGVSVQVPDADSEVKVVISENDVVTESSWSGKLPQSNRNYYIAPKINYKFDRLYKITNPFPLDFKFEVMVDGKSLGTKTDMIVVQSINDCPLGVANSEETLDSENAPPGASGLGWMFAAYVDENHPSVDMLLHEALGTKLIQSFHGYEARDPADVLKQTFAVWTAVQNRNVQHGSNSNSPLRSKLVNSQFVHFLDDSLAARQINAIDGTVLFASLLLKIGIDPSVAITPGRTYIVFNLSGSKTESQYVGLETTLIAAAELDSSDAPLPEPLGTLANQLGENIRTGRAWKSFVAAIMTANDDLQKNQQKFNAGDPEYQLIDIGQARPGGITPISSRALSH